MAEPSNGGNPKSKPPQEEMSMEMRLLLAFILMGAVMFVWQFLYKPEPPPPLAKTPAAGSSGPAGSSGATGSSGAQASNPAAATSATPPAPVTTAASTAAPTSPATPQRAEPVFVVDTDLFKVTFSNQGATARSWILKKYHGNDEKPLDLTNPDAGTFPLSLYFPGAKPTSDVNWTWYTQTPDPDGLGVTYRFSDGHTTVAKVFHFKKNSYLWTMSCEVMLDGKPLPNMVQWRGGFGDLTVASAASNQRILYFDVSKNSLTEQVAASVSKSGASGIPTSGSYSFAALADTYFGMVFLPENNSQMQVISFGDTVHTNHEEKPLPYGGLAVTDGAANRFDVFTGPKDVDLLRSINPKLEQVVNFGWLSVLAKPLFLVVNWLNDRTVHNFGWAIVLVTLAINFALFPLKLTNMKSMRKMQALKPQIDAINEKYKNVSIRDPRKADQNQEVMDLYKKHGVNPMGGCVPMLLQIPFFIAFYKVFTVSVEMRGASWLWVHDLSQPETLPIKILPLAMIASQFVMQKMTPQAGGVDPNQQKMMMFMPLIFGIMFYNFPSGLVLYYLTSNLVSMGQQYFFNHTEAAAAAARSVGPPPKKGRK